MTLSKLQDGLNVSNTANGNAFAWFSVLCLQCLGHCWILFWGVKFASHLSNWRWAKIPIVAWLYRCYTFPIKEKSLYMHTCCTLGCFWFATAHFGGGLPGPWFPNRSQNCCSYCPNEAEWCSMCENAQFVLSHKSFVPRAYISLLEELNINNLCTSV